MQACLITWWSLLARALGVDALYMPEMFIRKRMFVEKKVGFLTSDLEFLSGL